MKIAIRAFALAAAVCFLCSGCAKTAANQNNDGVIATSLTDKPVRIGNAPCSFPLVTEPTALNILACGYGDMQQENVFVWQQYSKMTGVDVNWTTVTKDDRSEAVNAALSNSRNIDLILRCKLSASRLLRYGQSGLLVDLSKDGLLQTYAPNCWAYLQQHPETLASITNPDGSIYALPQVNSGAEQRVGLKLFVNKLWLDRVGMALPSSTEEFHDLLAAFKQLDANGNGDRHDEIPFCCPDWSSVQLALYGAFGLANRGMHNLLVDYDENSGGVRLIAASDEYRAYLEYLRRLYAEGLLDNYCFTMTSEQWASNIANGLVGVFASTNLAWLPADQTDDWVAVETALEGPGGEKLWSPIRANFHSTGAAAIPSACSDPALVLRWLDFFWTDKGTLFYHMGVEGETFVSKDDGSYAYMPRIYEEMAAENKSFDDVVAAYSPYPGGSNPTVEIAPYFMGGEMAAVPAAAARKLFAYGPTEYWPSFTFTTEENDALAPIQADIEKYCESARIEFVTGARPLSDWDAYTAQLRKLKVQTLLEIYQAAVDRYAAFCTAR